MQIGWPDEFAMPYHRIMSPSEGGNDACEHVVFDFGNVLVYWDPTLALKGVVDDEVIEQFITNDISHFYDACNLLDEGCQIAQVREYVNEQAGAFWAQCFDTYIERFIYSVPGEVPGMAAVLTELRERGVGVWGLSNWHQDLFALARSRYAIFDLLDDSFISGFHALRKPDLQCFRAALQQFSIPAGVSVFVDDKAANVQAATQVGMRAIRFERADLLRHNLGSLGVLEQD